MLVFNCSKAATDFFTVTKKGEKFSCIEPPPEKTIAETLDNKSNKSDQPNWQWLVHAIKVKRKNVLIVMDCKTRFSMSFTGLKKGDEIAFLNMFEHHIGLHVNQLMQAVTDDIAEIDHSFSIYGATHISCAFHQRSDRSVQNTINDVAWYFDNESHNVGYVLEDFALIKFDAFVNKLLRKNKNDKDYFSPHHRFLHNWLSNYTDYNQKQIIRKITTFQNDEMAFYRHYDEETEITPDVDGLSDDTENKLSNVISLDLFRKR